MGTGNRGTLAARLARRDLLRSPPTDGRSYLLSLIKRNLAPCCLQLAAWQRTRIPLTQAMAQNATNEKNSKFPPLWCVRPPLGRTYASLEAIFDPPPTPQDARQQIAQFLLHLH